MRRTRFQEQVVSMIFSLFRIRMLRCAWHSHGAVTNGNNMNLFHLSFCSYSFISLKNAFMGKASAEKGRKLIWEIGIVPFACSAMN